MNSDLTDLHEICTEGDYSALKELLERRNDSSINEYKLFVYRRNPTSARETDEDFDDEDEDFPSDDHSSDSGAMFDYRSPLFYAIFNNHLACVKLLLQSGANPTHLRFVPPLSPSLFPPSLLLCSRPWGLNALCLATYLGHHRLVEYFLQSGFNANETDKPNGTDHYFHSLPSTHEHKQKMREMHSRVAQDLGMFHYPLHIAIKQDSIALVQLFLRFQSNVQLEITEAYTKKTSLHIAAEKCSTEVRTDFLLCSSAIAVASDHSIVIGGRSCQ